MHRSAALLSIAAAVSAQQIGTNQAENHPALTWQQCTASGCSNKNGQVVLDANWRWTHNVGGFTNCYTGNTWDSSICSTDTDCATKCAIDGADYSGTYGITTASNALTLKFKTGSNIGSRTYLMADENTYQGFTLLNNEFTFDVDVSGLGCGLNGALYFVSMDLDGGKSKFPSNAAGAKYGTGYCDSQCPRDLKFIAGKANIEGWAAESNSANSGRGNLGSCCTEMDIWEANSISEAVTPHPCTTVAQSTCDATAGTCGGTGATDRYAGVCDPDGCDFNPFRMGNTSFFGPGKTLDTTKKFTVVTQFPASGGSLSAIKRYFIQNGKVFANPQSDVSGVSGNQITSAFCDAQKKAFGDTTSFQNKGGMAQMSKAFSQPMVLVLSLWDDYAVNMLWLDSTYPPTAQTTAPGVARGTCSPSSGVPADVENSQGNSQVIYSNIRFGPIGSTTPGSTLSG